MQNMSHVVQQRSGYDCRAGLRLFGKISALQAMFENRNLLAKVGIVAFSASRSSSAWTLFVAVMSVNALYKDG